MVKWFLIRFGVLFGGALLSLQAMGEEGELLKVKMYKSPRREMSIIVTPEGYYPQKISVFKGEKVKFFVTSTVGDPSCFLIKDHDIYLSAFKGNLTEGEVHFRDAGEFEFYCPSTKHKGLITVIKKRDPTRAIASKKVETRKEWTPRE